MASNTLITYFSWGGNAKALATLISKQINSELFEIKTVQEYPEDYTQTTVVAKAQKEKGELLELQGSISTDSFNTIFIVLPVWWYTIPVAIKSFVLQHDFKGKTVVPIITHGGGGAYTIKEELQELCKTAKVLDPFVVYEGGDDKTEQELKAFLKDFNLII